MPQKDFFGEPFDAATLTKLNLYRLYIQEWLPVFLLQSPKLIKHINIFDLYCGPGVDRDGKEGSPVILLKVMNTFLEDKRFNAERVRIFFNDKKKHHINALEAYIKQTNLNCNKMQINFSVNGFHERFEELLPVMKMNSSANFMFIDQCGISAMNPGDYQRLLEIPRTDWLLFVSSSILLRFCEHEDVRKYISLSQSELDNRKREIHLIVTEYYRRNVPSKKTPYFVLPFSIEKGSNIYGLIFGSGHALGADKFIKTCWSVDKDAGEANYIISSDRTSVYGQKFLFSELTKKEVFKNQLKESIISKKLATNIDIYIYTLEHGMKPEHAREALRELKENKTIKNTVAVSYRAYKEKKVDTLKLV